jgi:hypothetical protein
VGIAYSPAGWPVGEDIWGLPEFDPRTIGKR